MSQLTVYDEDLLTIDLELKNYNQQDAEMRTCNEFWKKPQQEIKRRIYYTDRPLDS